MQERLLPMIQFQMKLAGASFDRGCISDPSSTCIRSQLALVNKLTPRDRGNPTELVCLKGRRSVYDPAASPNQTSGRHGLCALRPLHFRADCRRVCGVRLCLVGANDASGAEMLSCALVVCTCKAKDGGGAPRAGSLPRPRSPSFPETCHGSTYSLHPSACVRQHTAYRSLSGTCAPHEVNEHGICHTTRAAGHAGWQPCDRRRR
jgi:hypothetical protein